MGEHGSEHMGHGVARWRRQSGSINPGYGKQRRRKGGFYAHVTDTVLFYHKDSNLFSLVLNSNMMLYRCYNTKS